MYRFTIDYYYETFHTGELNITETRRAMIIAKNKNEAIEKIKQVDEEYILLKYMCFEQLEAGK